MARIMMRHSILLSWVHPLTLERRIVLERVSAPLGFALGHAALRSMVDIMFPLMSIHFSPV